MNHRPSPPLIPVATLAERWSLPRRAYGLSSPDEPRDALRRLVCSEVDFDELASRTVGATLDLLKVQANLSHASLVARAAVQDLVADVGELLMRPHARLIVATRLIADAMLFLDAAFVMHVRVDTKPKPALVLLRSALEVLGRAMVIAEGTSDEVDAFANAGESISSKKAIPTLSMLATRHQLPPTDELYGWLCSFSHYDVLGVHATPSPSDVYAVVAYTSIIAARAAERVLGEALAELPTLPVDLPWTHASKKRETLVITDADNREIANNSQGK